MYVTERGESLHPKVQTIMYLVLLSISISSPYLNFNISCLRFLTFISSGPLVNVSARTNSRWRNRSQEEERSEMGWFVNQS